MTITHRLLPVGAIVIAVGLSGAPAAYALTCDEYSQGCDGGVSPGGETPDSGTDEAEGVQEVTETRVQADATTRTLPFTGGETTLIALAGAGALAGGTALVVAGRRRSTTS